MQPVVIQDAISIAANSVNENVIVSNNALRALQRLPFPAKVLLAAVQSAAGLQLDFYIASKRVVASSNPRVSASTPELPLDVINGNAYGEEGAILVLRVANPTGGALTLRYQIIAEALADSGVQVQLPPDEIVMQQGPTNVPNGTVDQQLLDGLPYEYAPADLIMDILMTSSAAGLTRQVFVDMDRVAPSSSISLANRIPQDPFDTTVTGVQVPADEQVQLAITNNSGGALSVFWKTVMQELVRQ